MTPIAIALYAGIAFLFGIAAGFQGVYERYRSTPALACTSMYGIAYLLTRGGAPAVIYYFAADTHWEKASPLLAAVGCGIGVEAFARSKFYIGQKESDGGEKVPLMVGGFDFLRWYQSYFLERIDPAIGRRRKRQVRGVLKGVKSFPEMRNQVA